MASQNSRRSNRDDGARLTPEVIVRTALRMADAEEDPRRLTMRSLAAELNVGAMTLYTYFRNKDEILDGMADLALGELVMPDAVPDPASALRSFAYSMLDVMREHPSVGRLLASRLTDGRDAMYGSMEVPLRRLVEAGIPGPLAARCYGFVVVFAIGFSSYHLGRPWGYADSAPETGEKRRQREHYYLGLPIDRFPTVVELAASIVDIPSDATYEFGVEALVALVSSELGLQVTPGGR